jgi:HEAT repeat protein
VTLSDLAAYSGADREQIGGIGSRASALEAAMHAQESALRDLQKSNAQTRDSIAALEAKIGEGLSSQREIAEKSLVDLKAQNETVRKAGIDLGQKIDELREASQTRGAELDRKNDEMSHRLAKGEDDNRAILDRLAKLEDVAAHPPIPTATASAPTASRWSALVADLQSPKAATRWQAVDQIGQAADPEAVPYLLPMLKDTDVFVRMATARVLGDLKATTAVPPLIDSLEDVEPAVREAALGSLRALTGKDLRFDPMASESDRAKKVKAWRDWWKKVEDEGGLGKSQG